MTEPRAYTEAAAQSMFFDHLAGVFRYWRDVELNSKPKDQTELAYRMEGALFSTLVMFDGGSMAMPAFVISPAPHPDDEAYHCAHGENWWDVETMVNDTQMHEVFPWSKLREPGMPDTPPPLPEQPKDVWLAVINYKDGTNFYAQPTKAKLDAEIAEYCRQCSNGEEVTLTDAMTDEEVIDTYFDAVTSEDLVREVGPVTV